MNERIRDLAEKAGFELQYNCSPLEGEGEIYYTKEFEKFAELIVKECSELIQLTLARSICPMFTDEAYERGYLDGRNDAAYMIKDYFGVDE